MNLSQEAFVDPVHDMIVVKLLAESEVQTRGGIVLPTVQQNRPTFMGIVLAVGPGRFTPDASMRVPVCVELGDKILFRRGADVEMNIGGESRIIIREPDVIAKVRTLDVEGASER